MLYSYSLEVRRDVATLYLRGLVRDRDVAVARAMCVRLPETVTTLRIDVHGVRVADSGARDGIASLVREWRRVREGAVLISAGFTDIEALASDTHDQEPLEPLGPQPRDDAKGVQFAFAGQIETLRFLE